uniref:Protein FAM204A n=1 Tax=Astyanax mexicanus TaxID=7994 RepID=A0A8B9KGU6_ASTMX
MYSGLLPKGLSEADVSSSGEEEEDSRLKAPSPGAEPDLRPPSPPASNLSYRAEAGSGCASGQTGPSTDGCLPGVPPQLWQKFKDLQREKEDQKLDQPHRKRRRKTRHQKDRTQEKDGDTEQKRECEEERGKHWEELTQYFGTNERFQPPACSRPPLKSGLEKSMESAIAEGDYAKAEELSDRLATREIHLQRLQDSVAKPGTRQTDVHRKASVLFLFALGELAQAADHNEWPRSRGVLAV